jgi:HEAT repeat protein
MPLFNFSRRPNVQELKSQGDVDGLIEALSYQDDPNIRLAAASALGRVGAPEAVDPLVEALDDQQNVTEMAALSLGEIGDPRAVEPLISTLEQDDWEVRSSVAKALGKIGDERAVPSLVNLLENTNSNVRWHAAQALESITGESYGEEITQWEQLITEGDE